MSLLQRRVLPGLLPPREVGSLISRRVLPMKANFKAIVIARGAHGPIFKARGTARGFHSTRGLKDASGRGALPALVEW
jgi:hypothetical protein